MSALPRLAVVAALSAALFLACTTASQAAVQRKPAPEASAPAAKPRKTARAARTQRGGVSYYHPSLAGRLTASGAPYDPTLSTCAHRRWPFGTRVQITIVASGKSAVCTVNDRGPFVRGRVLDVSGSLAAELGIEEVGVARARIRRLR